MRKRKSFTDTIVDSVFKNIGRPSKSDTQRSSERGYAEGYKKGRSGGGRLERFGDVFGVPFESEEHKSEMAGIRDGNKDWTSKPWKTKTPRRGSSSSSESDRDSTNHTTEEVKTGPASGWFGMLYFGFCTLLWIVYIAACALNGHHEVERFLGLSPQANFWDYVSLLWSWTNNQLLRLTIMIVTAIVGICLIPGMIVSGIYLAIASFALAIILAIASFALAITVVAYRQNRIAGILVGLLIFLVGRALWRKRKRSSDK